MSKQAEPRFCRISKTPLHSQLAKPQHSNVTWDQVLLEQIGLFVSTFTAPALFAEPSQGMWEEVRTGQAILHASAPS